MAKFTLPRDLYHGKGTLETLKTLKGKRAVLCVGGGSMKRAGFLDRACDYLKEAGMEVRLFEGIEADPSVETVERGAKVMLDFQPDWIVAMGGGSPIDAAKAMWIKKTIMCLTSGSKRSSPMMSCPFNFSAPDCCLASAIDVYKRQSSQYTLCSNLSWLPSVR